MYVLAKPLNLAILLSQEKQLKASLVRAAIDHERIYLKRIASLNALFDECGRPATYRQQYTLAFVSKIDQKLNELEGVVLIAPRSIVGDKILYSKLIESNIVMPVDNPRLQFIRLANLIEPDLVEHTACPNENGPVIYGKSCLIKVGAVIGQSGYGFERDENGTPIRFPHFGRVVLGDNTEVGANTVISRGTLEDTVIGNSTKIDDLVYIAHNCKIGKNVMIAGNATLCGGVRVGDGAWIGAGASIKQNIEIGEGATVGMGAVVTKNVCPYSTVAGNPAKLIKRQENATNGAV